MHRPLPRAVAIVFGALLVVAPPLGFALKVLSAGWVLIVTLFVSPLLLLGYLLQLAIAITALLLPRALWVTQGRRRPLVAGAVTAAGVLAVGFFLLDYDDSGAGYSVFTDLVVGHGAITTGGGLTDAVAAAEDASNALAALGAVLWIGGWVWLVSEWGVALRARSRRGREPRDPPEHDGPRGPDGLPEVAEPEAPQA